MDRAGDEPVDLTLLQHHGAEHDVVLQGLLGHGGVHPLVLAQRDERLDKAPYVLLGAEDLEPLGEGQAVARGDRVDLVGVA